MSYKQVLIIVFFGLVLTACQEGSNERAAAPSEIAEDIEVVYHFPPGECESCHYTIELFEFGKLGSGTAYYESPQGLIAEFGIDGSELRSSLESEEPLTTGKNDCRQAPNGAYTPDGNALKVTINGKATDGCFKKLNFEHPLLVLAAKTLAEARIEANESESGYQFSIDEISDPWTFKEILDSTGAKSREWPETLDPSNCDEEISTLESDSSYVWMANKASGDGHCLVWFGGEIQYEWVDDRAPHLACKVPFNHKKVSLPQDLSRNRFFFNNRWCAEFTPGYPLPELLEFENIRRCGSNVVAATDDANYMFNLEPADEDGLETLLGEVYYYESPPEETCPTDYSNALRTWEIESVNSYLSNFGKELHVVSITIKDGEFIDDPAFPGDALVLKL